VVEKRLSADINGLGKQSNRAFVAGDCPTLARTPSASLVSNRWLLLPACSDNVTRDYSDKPTLLPENSESENLLRAREACLKAELVPTAHIFCLASGGLVPWTFGNCPDRVTRQRATEAK
jgi:hypothetical protein